MLRKDHADSLERLLRSAACSFGRECSTSRPAARQNRYHSDARGALMPNTRKILIVEDDSELREALTEQLSLHEEFEAVAVENGSKGVQTAKVGQIDLVIMDV